MSGTTPMTCATVVPNSFIDTERPTGSFVPHSARARERETTALGAPVGSSAAVKAPPARIGIRSALKYELSTKRTSAVGASATPSPAPRGLRTVVAGAQQSNGRVVATLADVTVGIARTRANNAS